jgi:hypothetical protein
VFIPQEAEEGAKTKAEAEHAATKKAEEEAAATKTQEEDFKKRAAEEAAKKHQQEVRPHESAWLSFGNSRARQCVVVDSGDGIAGSGDRPDSSHGNSRTCVRVALHACSGLLHSASPATSALGLGSELP